MGDEIRCAACDCLLTLGNMEFRGHTDERCREWSIARVRHLTETIARQQQDIAILRDTIARHDCAALRSDGR
jgi:uncharacterized protein YcgI (DUF1989 family)